MNSHDRRNQVSGSSKQAQYIWCEWATVEGTHTQGMRVGGPARAEIAERMF